MYSCFLIVDDDIACLHILKRNLTKSAGSRNSLAFLTAKTGEEALEIYKEHAASIDIIFSDLNMLGISGIDLLREVRERDSRIPFILLSTLANETNIIEVHKAGVTMSIAKPFAVGQLRRKFTAAFTHDAADPLARIYTSGG